MVRASELVSDRSGTVMCVSGAEKGGAMGVIVGGKGVAMERRGLGSSASLTEGGPRI